MFNPPSQFSRLGTQLSYSFSVCVFILFGLSVAFYFATDVASVLTHVFSYKVTRLVVLWLQRECMEKGECNQYVSCPG